MEKIGKFFDELTRKQVISFFVFLGASFFSFFMVKYGEQVSKIGYIVLFVESTIIISITWGMAGHTVMKVLFGVSAAGLSLLIYLAQSYCEVPVPMRTNASNAALMSLVGFGILYIGYEFIQSLYKEVSERLKKIREINSKEKPWFIILPYGLFTGLFTWQVVQVIFPIIFSLCIYK